MKYILTPTTHGEEKGKKPLEFTDEKKAQFAMATNKGYYELTESSE